MFEILPLEVLERILFYLNSNDVVAIFTAFDEQYCLLSDYFWKTICLKEDLLQSYPRQEWHECFETGMNKRLGRFSQITDIPCETLKHIYSKLLITGDISGAPRAYNVYSLDEENKFNLIQQIEGYDAQFRDEFITVQNEKTVLIYAYNYDSNIYEHYKSLPTFTPSLFGINKKHCVSYDARQRCFHLYTFHESYSYKNIKLPSDVKFLIPVENILHSEEVVVCVLSFDEGYKIKVYDIRSNSWTLDLVCLGSTGITNNPNVWVGSKFFGCCDVSYRSRGIYFGPFKVWDKQGTLLFQEDIETSNKHYLRCFFKDNFILLTTSDCTVTIFNSCGQVISRFNTTTSFIDVKLSTGNLLFILLEEHKIVQVYDWTLCTPLYSIQLNSQFNRSLCSEWLYCPYGLQCGSLEVIKFF